MSAPFVTHRFTRARHAWLLAAGATLLLCSCRVTQPRAKPPIVPTSNLGAQSAPSGRFAAIPLEGYTGHPGDGYTVPGVVPPFMQGAAAGMPPQGAMVDQTPLPINNCGPWRPPGIEGPWPDDEYIYDGGDNDGQVKVRNDFSLAGLDPEDTVAHYDTLDGKTVVKPTCRVCIYAPRFAAVRQVIVPYDENQNVKAGGVEFPIKLVRQDEVQPVTTTMQPVQPIQEIGKRAPITFLEHQPPVGLIAQVVLRAVQDRYKPYEDFTIIRTGLIQENERALIHRCVVAAIQWTQAVGVQVTIEGQPANDIVGDQRAEATYRVDTPDHPCLRVCKVASAASAAPGEIVEFTIRFDNTGDQTIGNVTIVDSLTTRLELVDGSGQCSRKAKFYTNPNEVGSLIMHWEIEEPLKPGEGGIARFKCKVR